MPGTMDAKSAEALEKSIQAVNAASEGTSKIFEEQLRIVTEMRDVFAQISGNLKDAGSQNQSGMLSPDNVKILAKELDNTNKNSKSATNAIGKLDKIISNKLVKSLIVAEAGLKGFTQGFMGVINLQKGVFSFLGGVVGGLFKVGRAILAIPFKMMDGLFNMAKKGNDNSYAQALEEVREQFGDLKSESASTVINLAQNMGKFDNTGVSAWKIWGNAAERLKAVNEFAKGLGPSFQVFEKEIAENGEAIMRYQKGLGATDAEMAGIASSAMRTGKGLEEVSNNMSKQAIGMSKAFGVNAKVISKDMVKAVQDLAHFGHLSTNELGVATAFANKMGISVDKLTSMMDATKTFDQAAEGMSKLNEQYGTNIDSTQIMMAQSPAEKFALVAKGFRDAGKDLTKLTIQDRDFIKAQSGMTDQALDAMIANKDAADMFAAMQKQGDKNEKKTLSQADAMKDLSESIVRLTKTGETGSGGILQHFLDGIAKGLQSTPEFRDLMRNINIIFRDAIMYGVKLGRMIFGLDNGLSGIVGGLSKAFDPQRYRKMFQGVLDAFAIFHKGGEDSTKNFMDKLHEVFFNFFKADAPAGKKMLGGFAKFGEFLVKIISGIGSWVVKKLTDVIPEITKIIPKLFESIKKGATSFDPKQIKLSAPAWAGPLIDLFIQIKTKLIPVLIDLFKAIWKEVGPTIKEGLKDMFLAALSVGAFKAVLNMAVVGLLSVLWNTLVIGMGGAAATGATGAIATALSGVITGALSIVATGFTAILGTVLAPALIVAAVAYSAVKVGDAIKTYGKVLEDKGFDPATAKIAAGTTGLINTLTLGLLPADLQLKIAESFAKMYKWIFDGLTKIFGPSFTTSIKEALSGAFQAFGGLGDLISSMWKGDSKGVEQALRDIAEGLIKGFLAGLEFVKIEIPLAIAKLSVWVVKGIAALAQFLFDKIGDIFVSLEKIPLVGPLLGLIGDIFHKLGTVAGGIKDLFGGVLAFLKLINIPAWFKSAGEAMSNFFKNSQDGANGFLVGIFDWGKKLVSFIETPFRAIREMFNALFSWDSNKSGLENLQNNFKDSFNILAKWWDKWVDQIIGVLIEGPIKAKNWIANNFNKATFAQIGKDIIDGLESQIKKIEDRFSEPFKKGLEHVKTFFGIHSPSKTMEEIGKNIVLGLWSEIKDIGNLILQPFKDGLDKIKNFLGIHSASVELKEVGKNMGLGLVKGTENIADDMKTVGKDALNGMKDGLGSKGDSQTAGISPEAIEKMKESVKGILELTKDIPADDSIKGKLAILTSLLESLNKMSASIADVSKNMPSSGDPLESIRGNLSLIFNVLGVLNGVPAKDVQWQAGIADINAQIAKLPDSRNIAEKSNVLKETITSLASITNELLSITKNMPPVAGGDPLTSVRGNLLFIFNVLQYLNGELNDSNKWTPSIADINAKLNQLPKIGNITEKAKGIQDMLSGLSGTIASLLNVTSKLPDIPGGDPLVAMTRNLGFIFNTLQILNGQKFGEAAAGISLKNIVDKLNTINVDKSFSEKAKNIQDILLSLSSLARSIMTAMPTDSKGGNITSEVAVKTIGENLSFIGSVIDKLAANDSSSLNSIIDKMSKINAGKNILDKVTNIQEIITKLSSLASSLKSEVTSKGNDGKDFIENVKSNLAFIGTVVTELTTGANSINVLTKKLDIITADKNIVDKVKNLSDIMSGLSSLSTSLIKTLPTEAPGTTNTGLVSANIKFIGQVISLLNGDTVTDIAGSENGIAIGTLLTKINKIKDSKITNDAASAIDTTLTNYTKIGKSFETFSGDVITTKTDIISTSIRAVQDMVSKTRELDNALTKMPKMSFPAKLESIASGMGLGGKFAYTVQGKDVVINVEFNVTMEVDKVEQILISRTSSIIRDRINFAIDHATKDDNTKNALIKSKGPQTGFVASDAAP